MKWTLTFSESFTYLRELPDTLPKIRRIPISSLLEDWHVLQSQNGNKLLKKIQWEEWKLWCEKVQTRWKVTPVLLTCSRLNRKKFSLLTFNLIIKRRDGIFHIPSLTNWTTRLIVYEDVIICLSKNNILLDILTNSLFLFSYSGIFWSRPTWAQMLVHCTAHLCRKN